ncbi:MAG: shikimate dehydrogenase [Victivallaceae bacterium]|nr:shikimate dehydrogenase [Victivallaceae bacterium]
MEDLEYLVIGDPIAHSKSPEMQNAAFRAAGLPARYGKRLVRPEELGAFVDFARTHLRGFNVTVPHKNAILPFLDEIDPAARLAESVNTVKVMPSGLLRGCSTDGIGVERAVRERLGFDFAQRHVIIWGVGGAGSAAAWHLLLHCGVKHLTLINRTQSTAQMLAEKLLAHAGKTQTVDVVSATDRPALRKILTTCDLLIQATSCGLRKEDAPLFPEEDLDGATCAVFDFIYHETKLLRAARQRNLLASDGAGMLLYQGSASFFFWTGISPDEEAMRTALEASQNELVR